MLDSGAMGMDETGIAWASDVSTKFMNPSARDTTKYEFLDQMYPDIVAPFTVADPQVTLGLPFPVGTLMDHMLCTLPSCPVL